MDYIRFADDSRYLINDFASIGDTVISPLAESKADALIASLTPDNLASVEYLHNEDVIGRYKNMSLAGEPEKIGTDGKFSVRISMTET